MPPSVCLDFHVHSSKYTIMDERSTKIFMEVVGCQLSDNYLKHAKVLPGGRKISILISTPCVIYEEGFIRLHVGQEWNPNSALAVAFNTQVVQPVHQMFPGSDSTDGDPIIIDLDEQCVEKKPNFSMRTGRSSTLLGLRGTGSSSGDGPSELKQ